MPNQKHYQLWVMTHGQYGISGLIPQTCFIGPQWWSHEMRLFSQADVSDINMYSGSVGSKNHYNKFVAHLSRVTLRPGNVILENRSQLR